MGRFRSLCHYIIIIMLGFILSNNIISDSVSTKGSLIRIIIDNISGQSDSGLMATGGYSAWIETHDKNILFDTGGDYPSLTANIERLKLDPVKLDAVFISHNHWDHAFGLPGIMKLTGSKPAVYVAGYSHEAIREQFPRASIVPVDTQTEIFPGIWSTGQMRAEILNTVIHEQSMIIEKGDKIFVITGCAHPGIVEIAEKAKSMFPDKTMALLAGGFHLRAHSVEQLEEISSKLKEIGVKAVAPSHCTGDGAIEYFRKTWADDYVQLHLGDKYRF